MVTPAKLTYGQALEYLSGLETYGIKLGLEQVTELLGACGNPHEKLRFIHVAGTNGKGSVCAMLAAGLRAAGFRTGFYSSPHLVSVRERFRIDGTAVPELRLAELVSELKPHADRMKEAGRCPTYFEFTTAVAAQYFASENADFAVWETGMGGRFDATNIVIPVLSAITSIGLDHCQFLGRTELEIAREKAGIIKSGVPCFCGAFSPDVEYCIRMIADSKNAPCRFFKDSCKILEPPVLVPGKVPLQRLLAENVEFQLSLLGPFQAGNAFLAFQMLKLLSSKYSFDLSKALDGLANTKWPARFQVLRDGNILDGGHNPSGAATLFSALQEYCPGKKFDVIYGSLADKDSRSILAALAPAARKFVFTPIKGSRKSFSADELAEIAGNVTNVPCAKASSPSEALAKCEPGQTLITGSLYLAGEVLCGYFDKDEVMNI